MINEEKSISVYSKWHTSFTCDQNNIKSFGIELSEKQLNILLVG